MPFVRSGEVRIYYETYGEGPPIVLSHAGPLDHAMWMYQIPYFSESYSVIAYDLRCYGRSDKPRTAFELDSLATDLSCIITSLGLERPVLVGLSYGGVASMLFALKYPGQARALVLADTMASGKPSGRSRYGERIARLRRGELDMKGFYASALHDNFSEAFREGELFRYFERLYARKASRGDAESSILMYEANTRYDITARLGEISVPTLVIAGTKDYAYDDCRLLSKEIPGAEFVSIEGSGHMTAVEAYSRFNEAVEGLLKRVP